MLIEEVKARPLIITDARDGFDMRRYIQKKKRYIRKPVKELWEKESEFITIKTVKEAINIGSVPASWSDPWMEMTRDFVSDDLAPEWIKGITTAGAIIEKRVNYYHRKQFDFNPTMWSVKDWIDSQGGKLIVELTSTQFNSIYAVLQHQIALNVTSPYILAQHIKPLVGLTERESLAVSRLMSSLAEEGIPSNIATIQIRKYAEFLHNNRADRIARTEISNAYNFGQFDSMSQAYKTGYLPGEPVKNWIAGGQDPCEICQANEDEGEIPKDDPFSSGHMTPTSHPNCECSVGYRIKRTGE